MLRHFDPGGQMYGSVGTANANLLAHWTAVNVNFATWSVVAGGGRTTGPCLRLGTTYNGNNYLSKTLDAQATWGVALAFKPTVAPLTGSPLGILALGDAGTAQVDLRLYADMTVGFTRNGTAIGAQSSAPLALGGWNHVEVKVTIHPSAGSIECRINGVAKIGPTGSLNTRNTANSSANQVWIGNTSGANAAVAGNFDFADIVAWDTQATDANGFPDIHDFISDCGVYWLLPTGAGTTTQFTPDTGSNYARVNEATPDGDTSYVESAVVGNIDTYALADLPAGVSAVKSLALVHYARKTDVGGRQLGATLRSGGANSTHATGVDLGNSYQYSARNWGCDPATSAAWTPSGVNALEVGPKVNS